jgi:hypothetical protein
VIKFQDTLESYIAIYKCTALSYNAQKAKAADRVAANGFNPIIDFNIEAGENFGNVLIHSNDFLSILSNGMDSSSNGMDSSSNGLVGPVNIESHFLSFSF